MTAVITDVHYRMSLSLIRDLSQAGVHIIACESSSVISDPATPPLGFYSKHTERAVTLPEAGYTDALYDLCAELCTQGERPALLPIGAKTLATIAQERERFASVAGLCIPTEAQLDLFNDKSAVQDLARELDIPVPHDLTIDGISFPCVIKPRCGERYGIPASDRYVIARDEQTALQAVHRFTEITGEEPIIEEYLPGAAYGCCTVCRDGMIVQAVCHKRVREYPVSGGPSSCCITINDPRLTDYAARLVAHTHFTGVAMFEFKADAAGQPRLLEINPRVWGSYPLTRAANSGMSETWYALAAGREPSSHTAKLGAKMHFFPSDLLALIGYCKRGEYRRALGALNPFVRDGLFEWSDMRPALTYYRCLFRRKKS